MRFHPIDEIDERIGRRVWCFREEIVPFTSDRGPRLTVAEIVAEVRLFYGPHAAGRVTITVH